MLRSGVQVVMPPLLHSAQLKPDVHITDLESTSDNEDDDDEVRNPAGKPVHRHTTCDRVPWNRC